MINTQLKTFQTLENKYIHILLYYNIFFFKLYKISNFSILPSLIFHIFRFLVIELWLILFTTWHTHRCAPTRKISCSKVAKFTGKMCIDLTIDFQHMRFFFVRLLVFQLWSILYMVDCTLKKISQSFTNSTKLGQFFINLTKASQSYFSISVIFFY